MQNLTGHLQGGSSDICLTISSSRLPVFFFPLNFARHFVGVTDKDLMGVLTGDGVEGDAGCGLDWVFKSVMLEDREIKSGGGVASKGGEGCGSRGGEAGGVAGEMGVGKGDDVETGGGFGSVGKKRGGVDGEDRGEPKNIDGDKQPPSSVSISFSRFTSAGGSIPYLEAILPSCMRHKQTSLGCL